MNIIQIVSNLSQNFDQSKTKYFFKLLEQIYLLLFIICITRRVTCPCLLQAISIRFDPTIRYQLIHRNVSRIFEFQIIVIPLYLLTFVLYIHNLR